MIARYFDTPRRKCAGILASSDATQIPQRPKSIQQHPISATLHKRTHRLPDGVWKEFMRFLSLCRSYTMSHAAEHCSWMAPILAILRALPHCQVYSSTKSRPRRTGLETQIFGQNSSSGGFIRRGVWFTFLVALSMAVFVTVTTVSIGVGTPIAQATELRGVWLTNIDSNVLFERQRLTKALRRLRSLNFNTLYPTIWNWGYTLYPSPVAKRVIGRSLDPTPGLQGRDILKEIVEQGHQKGMSVIPWFEFGFMAPADSDLVNRHPDWLTRRRDGTQIWQEGSHQRVWLNPFHPEVQQFIQDLIVEIVSNYDVEGIQFDDHFGFPSEFGYDTLTVQKYQQEHAGQFPPTNPQDPSWVRWRSDKITKLMRQLFWAVKDRKPHCIVSVAPNPLEFSYNYSLADWQSWEREGLIEELILQVYRSDLSRFIAELEQPEVQIARSHIPVSIGILTGLKDQFIPLGQIQNQVAAVRNRGLAGVSFFYYETLWNVAKEKPAERQVAFQGLFPAAMERPNIFSGVDAVINLQCPDAPLMLG